MGSVGKGLLLGSVGQQAGDQLVGELAKSQVDLVLQNREGSGIARQLFGPKRLLGGQVGMNAFQGLVRSGNGWSGLRVKMDTHGSPFGSSLTLLIG